MVNTDIEALYRDVQLLNMVIRRCRKILHNDEEARDAAHDVFEKLLEKKRIIDYPKSYLYEMATNMGINKIKKRRNEICRLYAIATDVSINRVKERGEEEVKELFRKEIKTEDISNEIFTDESYEQIEAKILVDALMNEEDDMTRVIYFMRYHDEMGYEDIGEAVGLSKSGVEKRLKKLEERIKIKLNKDNK
jgi:RNA polymerase sigma-70 factor (ECF subfamily)